MARFAPLPIISIDPRNEAQLVQNASQTVYEASNRTLNDFSAGNPLAALLEGQAFAQGEFLFWANQLPDKILIEWIGPFLGAMRKLGTPATAQLEVSISPRNAATIIPAGTTFNTNPQLTSGVSIPFISSSDLTIPAGEFLGKVTVYSKFTGTANNAPANSITVSTSSGSVSYTVTNPEPAVGGTDIETYQEIQERFFNLIRRPNPISATDWENFFIDLYGSGTLTSVQPNRSSAYSYNYNRDYTQPNGEVSFFVLGPNGIELTEEQLRVGQNVVNFSVPVENRGHLYPITLSQVQYNITLELDSNGIYGLDFKEASLNFRDRLDVILKPGSVFPTDINPTVSDIDAAFYNTFSSATRFKDPLINSSSAYNTPNGLNAPSAVYTQVKQFEPTEFLINENDLVIVNNPNPTFYPVESSFTPYSANKKDQTLYGNLSLKQIQPLKPGSFSKGDVVYYDGTGDLSEKGLHVVKENLSVNTSADILRSIANGKISEVKSYQSWSVGTSYINSTGGVFDPAIVEYDYSAGEFIPATPVNLPLNQRPGAFVWLVAQDFTLQSPTNDITGAQTAFLLGAPVTPNTLEPGISYSSGTWVCTPQVGSGPDAVVDPLYNYVDLTKGAVTKYAYVSVSFTYNPNGELTSTYFDNLIQQGILKEIVVLEGDEGLPIYKYKARFKTGDYLEFRETANSPASYYIAAEYFSPTSSDIQTLLDKGLVYNLAPNTDLQNQLNFETNSGVPGKLLNVVISDPGQLYVDGTYLNVPLKSNFNGVDGKADITVIAGEVVSLVIKNQGQNYSLQEVLTIENSYLGGTGSGVALTVTALVPLYNTALRKFERMFYFFKGDRTYFREGSDVKSYTATSAVSPLFNFNVYRNNGIFVETGPNEFMSSSQDSYIPFYNPAYAQFAEDTVVDEDGRNLYRVIKSFTPTQQVENWTGSEVVNTARYEEFNGNLLRYVTQYKCEEEVLPQEGLDTSSIRLGVASITIIPKNTGRIPNSLPQLTYVWEKVDSSGEPPELSWYTSTRFPLTPPDYGNGTLAL